MLHSGLRILAKIRSPNTHAHKPSHSTTRGKNTNIKLWDSNNINKKSWCRQAMPVGKGSFNVCLWSSNRCKPSEFSIFGHRLETIRGVSAQGRAEHLNWPLWRCHCLYDGTLPITTKCLKVLYASKIQQTWGLAHWKKALYVYTCLFVILVYLIMGIPVNSASVHFMLSNPQHSPDADKSNNQP
jgi:hypothetical protein